MEVHATFSHCSVLLRTEQISRHSVGSLEATLKSEKTLVGGLHFPGPCEGNLCPVVGLHFLERGAIYHSPK